MPLPWTKFQDFYLRLGFLKVLVSVLAKERTSANNESVLRRLRTPLFEAARSTSPDLWKTVEGRMRWYEKQHGTGDYSKPTVAEALLVHGRCPSWLFAITKPTAYKILDWGRDVGFVGRGNQITERGLLLRALLPRAEIEAFLTGDVLAWNPFVLSASERLFFFLHIGEVDGVTAELVRRLGELPPSTMLELRDAGKIVCECLHSVLEGAEATVRPAELPDLRVARELASTMAVEMELPHLVDQQALTRAMLKPGSRAVTVRRKVRKSTKNTDHQTVPRFEQLADLGFVRKQGGEFSTDEPRRRWAWVPTPRCAGWTKAMEGRVPGKKPWHDGFASAAVPILAGTGGARPAMPTPSEAAEQVWNAYELVKRPFGHTPLDSIALMAMLSAADAGLVLEMSRVHDLMLTIKRTGAIPDFARFAGGNALDEMFVRLRAGFVSGASDLE